MTATLTITFDAAELRHHAPRGIVLACEAEAWMMLRQQSATVLTPADVLAQGDFKAIDDDLHDCMSLWRSCVLSRDGGLSPLDVVPYRHWRWITRFGYLAMLVRRGIEATHANHVVLLDHPGGHGLDQASGGRKTNALSELAAHVARRCGATVEHLGGAEHEQAPETAPSQPEAPCSQHSCAPDHVLMLAGEVEIAHTEAVAHNLSERGLQVVCVQHGSSKVRHPGSGSLWVNDLQYAGPNQPLLWPDAPAARARLEAASSAQQLLGDVMQMASEHMSFLFDDYARAMQGHIARWRKALARHRPKAVVAMYPCVAIDIAAHMGIPTVILPHGPMIYAIREYHALLPEPTMIGAVGSAHAAILNDQDIARSRVRLTGVASVNNDQACPPPPNKPAILIVTSESAHPAQIGTRPVTDFVAEAQAIAQIARHCHQRSWRVEVRRHPRYDRSEHFYRQCLRDGGADEINICSAGSETLYDAAARNTVVVFTGAPSSATLIAAQYRPTCILGSAWNHPDDIDRWGLSRMGVCATVQDLIKTITLMVNDSVAFASAAANAHRESRRLLSPSTGEQAADLIMDTAAATPICDVA